MNPSQPSWIVEVDSGLRVFVPDRLSSLTTFVLLEQERWFESEIAIVGRLLEPGMSALDIGANHGVYSLALAQQLREGHVWSFEPTREPRARLQASIAANGLAERVTVLPLGLSDARREASFGIHANSELNSGNADGVATETVMLEALDALAPLIDRPIDFVKLDAEGEEARVLRGGSRFFGSRSPIVMFELRHGRHLNLPLIDQFASLGYDVYRHHGELDLLVAFKAEGSEHASVLNLFAIKPERAASMPGVVRRCDFVDPAGVAAQPAALQALRQRLWRGVAGPLPGGEDHERALACIATAHLAEASPGERVALLVAAREALLRVIASGCIAGPEPWVSLMHVLYALGQQLGAVQIADHVLAHWAEPAAPPRHDFFPPTRADLDRPRSTDLGSWLRLCVMEFVEVRRAYSSYFVPSERALLDRILAHPDHGRQMVRRAVLDDLRRNQAPDPRWLSALGAGRNGTRWASFAAAPADAVA